MAAGTGTGKSPALVLHSRKGGARDPLRAEQPSRLGPPAIGWHRPHPAGRRGRLVSGTGQGQRWLGDLDLHLWGHGRLLEAWRRLGAHPGECEGAAGTFFAVWAPNARRVSIVGDFNAWDGRAHPLRVEGPGLWSGFVPGAAVGMRYKYELEDAHGHLLPLKADPFAAAAELRPANASVIADPAVLGRPTRGDARANSLDAPISIYEVHLGSWRRGDGNRWLTYRELADQLPAYVADMGFTHVEFLPIMEHPFDGSWGYQTTGLFAPTSRFGSPADFKALVDACHAHGLAVILDWVPAHFPDDAFGLARFDGTALYEHADPRQGRHQDWGTLIYNLGRAEVANFLLASGLYWIEVFGVDALRVDAVASMLYLDYSRAADQWVPNAHGGRENLEAIDFLRRMNVEVFGRNPGATTMAEESTAWPGVSRPTDVGGLGFGYKWNMGWMHDTLKYVSRDPVHRRHHHGEITFGLHYAFSENFILPLSHDEVVHGKGTILGRMPGDDWQRFATLRAYYAFMFGHPGKKLLFMGAELAQAREWSEERALDWHVLEDAPHAGVQRLIRDLNHLYRDVPALHRLDCAAEGFAWVVEQDAGNSVFAWIRRSVGQDRPCLVVVNFTPQVHHGYRVPVPMGGPWREVLNTDASVYGGSNVGNHGIVAAEPDGSGGFGLGLTLPPLAALFLVPEVG
ncbi:1,4-alpha-glucan branching protein GlgB [Zavarzinia sp. CC-PAN008]|uniref:1,4-alpha-glucan branching protein GlgB n=1 Tax=Zavarzinia sp. CC-PAN008 TaxID=3243332 RepID=UPI003F74A7DB